MRRLALIVVALALVACGAPDAGAPAVPQVTISTPAPVLVKAGSYCRPLGGTGVTESGRPMICRLKPGEERPRWRKP